MQTKTNSPHFLQQRKFFMVLPLLVLPFITLIFWVLDGGKSHNTQAQAQTIKKGLNLELPAAYLKEDKALNKLSYYEKAASDSAKLEKYIKNDPYYNQQKKLATEEKTVADATKPSSLKINQNTSPQNSKLNTSIYDRDATTTDPNVAKVYQKLEQLNTVLKKAEVPLATKSASYTGISNQSGTAPNKDDLDRLEQMMVSMNGGNSSEDPEMQQLNGMLEKILDIQNPERVREKIRTSSKAAVEQKLPVAANNDEPISLLVNNNAGFSQHAISKGSSSNGFYSLENDAQRNSYSPDAISAVVHETQTIVEGSMVKLRLINDISIDGVLIPAGNFVFGVATLNGERLHIKINSIHYHHSLLPVALTVFDLDGINGIYIPGAITREVTKQSADRALQGIGLTTLDPSLGAQAAGVGIEAAKTLFSKKAKLVKVTVKAGYQVLLQDQKQKASS